MRKNGYLTTTAATLLVLAACAAPATRGTAPVQPTGDVPVPGTPEAQRTPELPPIPAVDGPLQLEVGYPVRGQTLTARDSNFIFGSTGSGRTQLTINGHATEVAPNGGFLAFIPVPADGVYRLQATKGAETASLEVQVNVPAPPTAGAGAGAGAARIASAYPTGALAVMEGEPVEVGFRAPSGGSAALLLPDGSRVRLVERGAVDASVPGDQFRTTAAPAQQSTSLVTYAAMIPATTSWIARDTSVARPRVGDLTRNGSRVTDAVLEYARGADTVRTPLRLNLAVLRDGVPRTGEVVAPSGAPMDYAIRGRNDVAGPFHYFWPPGTRLTITGERQGMYRVKLATGRSAYVPAAEVRLLPAGAPLPGGIVSSARFSPQPDFVELRVPTPERVPFQVTQDGSTLHLDVFGITSHADFFQYGGLDPLLEYAEWSQPADGVFRVSMRLARPVWGYQTRFENNALILRVRRPPTIDAAAPLRGLLIAVDAGHGGADRATRGPTGLTEADANLGIALQLRDLLRDAGAQVLMTRETDTTVALGDRPLRATNAGAHVLVSVHNNAFPDGVNPRTNAGTSTYYFHPHSADLARLMQRELLAELGLRDIGYGRADLALVRPTWMPAVLTETAFMMIPEHEAALRDPAVQRRIAEAHLRALEAFLRGRAAPAQ